MTEQVTAQVILRAPNGSSILTSKGPITAGNVAKYRVEKEVIEEASKKLEKLGFKVSQPGPVSLAVSGDKALFERVFQTILEARSKEIMGTKAHGAEASYYEAKEPIKVPEDLSSLVADVVLAIPPEFFP